MIKHASHAPFVPNSQHVRLFTHERARASAGASHASLTRALFHRRPDLTSPLPCRTSPSPPCPLLVSSSLIPALPHESTPVRRAGGRKNRPFCISVRTTELADFEGGRRICSGFRPTNYGFAHRAFEIGTYLAFSV